MFSKLIFPDALPTWALFAELAAAAVVVILAGSRFTRHADTLADRLNLGSGLVGLILLATVTSLPELVTGSTATWIGNVDLAMGNILGSCSFNITLIFLLNLLWRGGSVLRDVSRSHSLTSSCGVGLIGLALFGMVMVEKFAGHPRIAQTVELVWALVILFTYLACMRLIYRYERAQNGAATAGSAGSARSPVGTALIVGLTSTAAILVAASWWLAQLGDVLSTHKIEMIGRPLGATFVGACFLAVSTSLPEIVTSVAAVRLGKLDLALGNIFGSNMFNIFVIPVLKGVSLVRGDALLLGAGASHLSQNLIVGLLAILLTAIAIAGLACQSKRTVLARFGYDAILIALVYVCGMVLLLTEVG